MIPYYQAGGVTLYHGDCREAMEGLEPNSVDAVVTDPPYGLEFMGRDLDHGIPGVPYWSEALRVAKPGAHLLAFGGTRTHHRLTCAIEDAGWEIRDCIMWVYGSGFPKSLDVSKAIDKAAGAAREVVGVSPHSAKRGYSNPGAMSGDWLEEQERNITAPSTEAAKQWDGGGTALQPAWEPIILARKPLEGTVAANVQKWGAGGINVDGCRVGTEERTNGGATSGYGDGWGTPPHTPPTDVIGRFPANLIHDGSDEVLLSFPQTGGGKFKFSGSARRKASWRGLRNGGERNAPVIRIKSSHRSTTAIDNYGDSGSAARFFYTSKASKADRTHGNNHPTVKPTSLMRYLVRLVCAVGGTVLDPFNGSGTTTYAAREEGCKAIGVELSEEYTQTAINRLRQGVLEFA